MTYTEYKSILKMLVNELVSNVSYKHIDIGEDDYDVERLYDLDENLVYQAFLYITRDFDYNANTIVTPQYTDNLNLPFSDKELLDKCRNIISLLVLYFNDNFTTTIDNDDSAIQALPIGRDMNKRSVYLYYDRPFMKDENLALDVLNNLLSNMSMEVNNHD